MTQDIASKLIGTLAADEVGRPIVLYHGTFNEFSDFKKTRDIGFHFGSKAQALERRYEKARELKMKTVEPWHVMKVALSVHNVLVYPDDPGDWGNWNSVCGLSRLVDPDFLNRMKREGVTDSRVAIKHLRDDMISKGYDAIVYRNMFENKNGALANWSWLVLDSKSIVNLPSEGPQRVLLEEVGSMPGLELPKDLADIQGARGRNGRIRLKKDRMALIEAMEQMLHSCGGTMSCAKYGHEKPDENTYPIEFGDGLCGEMSVGIGRVSIDIPGGDIESFEHIVDDFVAYTGMRARDTARMSYEWLPGETAANFMDRLQSEIELIKDVISLHSTPTMT